MSDERDAQSQTGFSQGIQDLLEAQTVIRAKENRIGDILIGVIEKGREYRFHNQQLIDANKLLKRAMRKYFKISIEERDKNREMQHEMDALKATQDEMQQKLASAEEKYQQLRQKMSAVIRETEVEPNDVEVIECSQTGQNGRRHRIVLHRSTKNANKNL